MSSEEHQAQPGRILPEFRKNPAMLNVAKCGQSEPPKDCAKLMTVTWRRIALGSLPIAGGAMKCDP
jgi:hypothetical protein